MKNNQPNLNKLTHSLLAASALIVLTTQAHAALYNVDFNGGYFSEPNATYSGAAVTGAVGDFWNGFNASSGILPLPLADSSSAVSPINMSYDLMGTIYYAGPTDLFDGKSYEELMSAFGSIQDGPGTLKLTGFLPSSPYSLWVYTAGDASSGGGGNGATWDVNGGTSQTNIFDPATADFTLGNNYLIFTGNTSNTGEIVLKGTHNGDEGFINGIQLNATPAPEPTASLLSAVVGVLGLMTRRRAAKR